MMSGWTNTLIGYDRGTQNQRLLQLSQCANNCKEALRAKLEMARYSSLIRVSEVIIKALLPTCVGGF